jgi:hypothetical protein
MPRREKPGHIDRSAYSARGVYETAAELVFGIKGRGTALCRDETRRTELRAIPDLFSRSPASCAFRPPRIEGKMKALIEKQT